MLVAVQARGLTHSFPSLAWSPWFLFTGCTEKLEACSVCSITRPTVSEWS